MESSIVPSLVNSKAFTIMVATICIIVVAVFVEMKFKKFQESKNLKS